MTSFRLSLIFWFECVYIESAWYTSESNLSALLVRKSNFKVLIKSSYVISLINSRECKLYQVITAPNPITVIALMYSSFFVIFTSVIYIIPFRKEE